MNTEDQDPEVGAYGESPPSPQVPRRTFLCVVDETEELHQALRYACRRAKSTSGRVALLYVIEPIEYQHWMAVGHLMAEERREQAEEMLQVVSSVVQKLSGTTPVIFIREGELTEQLMHLIETESDLSILVLGAASGSEQAGSVISYVLKRVGRLSIPVTIVPGGLTDEQIDAIS